MASAGTSNFLIARQFAHALELDATPLGILAGIRRQATASDPGGYVKDRVVSLSVDGAVTAGANLAQLGANWPAAFGTAWYGGSDNLWGLGGLTAADVNSPNFSVWLSVDALVGGEAVGKHTMQAEVAEITTRVYYLASASDENLICFSQRSAEVRTEGCYRQHPTDDVWGRVVEEGSPPTAPPASGGRKGRAIIVPSQGDLQSLADAGDNKASVQGVGRRAYLFAREAGG